MIKASIYDPMDDCPEEDNDYEPPSCKHCDDTGSVVAMDYQSYLGDDYLACPHCREGVNSPYPLNPGGGN